MTTQPTLFDEPQTTPSPAAAPTRSTWLREHLIRTGHVTETGLTRAARLRPCPTRGCHDQVLAGLDDDQCALEVTCDPIPLNQLGEALALVDGRRTLAVRREGGRFVLDHRSNWIITAHPAGTAIRCDVVRQHQCGTPPLPESMTAASTFPETHPPLPPGSPPPF